MKLIYKIKNIEDNFKGRGSRLSFWLLIRILNLPCVLGKRPKGVSWWERMRLASETWGRCPSPVAQRCVTLTADSASLRPPFLLCLAL